MSLRIAAFPKCYLDDLLVRHTMSLFDWIEMARSLDADGLEMHDGFFASFDSGYLDEVAERCQMANFQIPMICCSPDFTHPDVDFRKREIDREAQMIRVSRRLGGPGAVCRVLSGQRYPGLSREQGLEWVIAAIGQLLPLAEECDVILGMENHYKDGLWQYPEFAQKQDLFLAVVESFRGNRHFGVQYDPSNAIVAGDDPLDLLRRVADRVVSMHASDRFLVEGATLEDLRQSDGTVGYSAKLCHGVTGKGLNDYHEIFRILAAHQYRGWISIEDGMNGMDEMRESLQFLRTMSSRYFPAAG